MAQYNQPIGFADRLDAMTAPVVDRANHAVAFHQDLFVTSSNSVDALNPRARTHSDQANQAAGDDTTNPGVGKWYRYSMLSHLLTSRRHVYAIRTADGHYAKLELLAYYCADAGTACLTFRYAYQGDGSRRVGRP